LIAFSFYPATRPQLCWLNIVQLQNKIVDLSFMRFGFTLQLLALPIGQLFTM